MQNYVTSIAETKILYPRGLSVAGTCASCPAVRTLLITSNTRTIKDAMHIHFLLLIYSGVKYFFAIYKIMALFILQDSSIAILY